MPTFEEWPKVLASAAEKVLSVPEVGYRMPVHASPSLVFESLPCIDIEWGNGGLWVEPSTGGSMSTLSQATGHFGVRIVVGDPGTWTAMAIGADASQRLLGGFADAVAADPDAAGIRPSLSGEVLTPEPQDLAAIPVWFFRIPLTVPLVIKFPPTTP